VTCKENRVKHECLTVLTQALGATEDFGVARLWERSEESQA
jgi:hypothetical protein